VLQPSQEGSLGGAELERQDRVVAVELSGFLEIRPGVCCELHLLRRVTCCEPRTRAIDRRAEPFGNTRPTFDGDRVLPDLAG
jgi:hypothetical protein